MKIKELLEQVNDKLDQDLDASLLEQERNLKELYDEKILALNSQTLKIEQNMIKAKRELEKKMEGHFISGMDAFIKSGK
jgi:hypothetical protein